MNKALQPALRQPLVSGGVISRPILFSTEMVKAILEGRKTQTRRIVKEPFQSWMQTATNPEWWERIEEQCKYGQIGDLLWVRETWKWEGYTNFTDIAPVGQFYYKADDDEGMILGWKPSIFMPREACRIELRIKNIRVERLQSISEEDARREGVASLTEKGMTVYKSYLAHEPYHWSIATARKSFETLWSKINGQQSWNENPFVWVIEFERTEMPSKHHR